MDFSDARGKAMNKLTKLYWHLAVSGIIAFGGCVAAIIAARTGL